MNEFKILRFINRLLPFGIQIVKWHQGEAPAENLPVFVIALGNRYERCVFKNNKFISMKTNKEVLPVIWWCYE